jgi:hypothetical protein
MAEPYWISSGGTDYLKNPAGAVLQTRPTPGYGATSSGQQNPSGPLSGIYGVANTAASTQAQDYSNIMGQYGGLAASATANAAPKSPNTYAPSTYQYTPSPAVGQSISALSSLTQSGGYAPSDIQAIRSRAAGGVRSVYDSANRAVDRNVALRNNSAGYNAVKAKLARDLGQQLSDTMVNSEASIADNAARNRINIAPSYASAAGNESSLGNQYGRMNADTTNDAQKFNIGTALDYSKLNSGNIASAADVLRGETSLYGTTPALSSLYGSQALNQASLQAQINNNNNQNQTTLLSDILRSMR